MIRLLLLLSLLTGCGDYALAPDSPDAGAATMPDTQPAGECQQWGCIVGCWDSNNCGCVDMVCLDGVER